MTEPTDDTLRDWLLGTLAPAEAEALEQRLIEDEAFAARLRAVENDRARRARRRRTHPRGGIFRGDT